MLIMAVACFFTGLFLLLCINCASSNTGRALNVGVVTAGALDIHSTHQGMREGLIEANPVMGNSLSQQAALKASGAAVIIAGTRWLEEKHPILAHVLRSLTITGWSIAAAHNYRLTQSTRQ